LLQYGREKGNILLCWISGNIIENEMVGRAEKGAISN